MSEKTHKSQRIAFWGVQSSFDFKHIGGTNALCRRLTYELTKQGHCVTYVYFNSAETKTEQLNGMTFKYNKDYHAALKHLQGNFDHIVSLYIPRALRWNWQQWGQKNKHVTKCHSFVQGWPDNPFKRLAGDIERRVLRPSGTVFCLSPRLHKKTLLMQNSRAALFLPPVPDIFFMKPRSKPTSTSLRINFMGRIDGGKGIKDVETFFDYVHQRRPDIKLGIYGYSWKEDEVLNSTEQRLSQSSSFHYEPCHYDAYSAETDHSITKLYQETDILFLPYRTLSTTIDTPLVLLEGLAHLCPVLGIAHGDMKTIYGSDKYFFDHSATLAQRFERLQELENHLDEERLRIYSHINTLGFRASQSAHAFLENIHK
ncbi:MAG: glycosyltransferase [Myxococcota bacterium]|jgi:glycosyltransferase involved in cell wall biosynthesis|nr:glycosyltransferase [Myxococcota bacterium]